MFKNLSRVINRISLVEEKESIRKNINNLIVLKTKKIYILYSCVIIGQNVEIIQETVITDYLGMVEVVGYLG